MPLWRTSLAAALASTLAAAPAAAAPPADEDAQAQRGPVPPSDHAYQTWLAAFVHGPLKGPLWLWTDAHLRMYESFQPSAILLRPGLSWRALPSVYLTGGYAWTPSWARAEGELSFTDEHRSWQQLMWTPKDEATGAAAMLRGRFEQRFRPSVHSDTGLRGRVLVRGQVPLPVSLPMIFVVWDELFIGLNDTEWGQRAGVDQNRLFVGVGWQIRPTVVRVELGYTNVWLVRDGADPVNHIIAINTFLGWPPRSARRART